MKKVGGVSMREALRLVVSSFSFSSNLKDAGISSPAALVAGYIVAGTLEAYRTQAYIKEKTAVRNPDKLTGFTLLTEPAFFGESQAGVKQPLASFNK